MGSFPRHLMHQVCLWRERWRFQELVPFEPVALGEISGTNADQPILARGFESQLLGIVDEDDCVADLPVGGSMPRRLSSRLQVPLSRRPNFAPQISHAKVSFLPSVLEQPDSWRLLFCGGWVKAEAIHCKEARVALMGLRRAARNPRLHDSLLLSLGGNMAEILAVEKGRAKDWELNGLCRRACSFQVACNIQWSSSCGF